MLRFRLVWLLKSLFVLVLLCEAAAYGAKLDNISIDGKSNVKISFYYNAYSLGTTGYMSVEVFVDDVSLGKENVFNGAENGSATDGWEQYVKTIDDGSSTVRLTIYAYNDQDYQAVDNFKIESGTLPPCEFAFGEVLTVCDTITEGIDTYTATIAYTGGSENIHVSASAGEIGGDDPSVTASGNIIISSIPEGEGISLSINSETCEETISVNAPLCIPPVSLPYSDGFDYETGSNLTASSNWISDGTSDDEILVADENLSYDGLKTLSGKSVSFAGGGNNALLSHEEITTGELYVSLIFKVTNMDGFTKGGYFAVIGDYNSRLYVKPNEAGNQFYIGLGNTNKIDDVMFGDNLYDLDEEIFVVMNVNITTGNSSLWVNPEKESLGAEEAPEATMSFLAGWIQVLNQFLLRQDSDSETPTLVVDDLRLGKTWAEVTPPVSTSAVQISDLAGLRIYPNPVKDGLLKIETSNDAAKSLNIFDITGKIVYSAKMNRNAVLDLANLKSGIYLLKVKNGKNIVSEKLVIQ